MCLALPVRIERLLPQQKALVTLQGVQREISVALLDDLVEGDFVILHVGYALQKLDEDEARKTLALFAALTALETSASKESQESAE